MTKNLNDFGTTTYDDGVDVGNLPEQGRQYPDPPPVGAYRFQMPRLTPDNFEPVTRDGEPVRARVKFNEQAPLVIVQSVGEAHNGEPFETSINNRPRERGKKGSGQFASDWDYLNQALGETIRPSSGQAYVQRLIARTNQTEPATFSADLTYSWQCREDKAAYWPDGNGGVQKSTNEDGSEKHGCGKKYYQKDVPKGEGGLFPVRILCTQCGAQVRAFANLERFRP